MTDLEITKLCAEAMGMKVFAPSGDTGRFLVNGLGEFYNPLENDAQAMALVKNVPMVIESETLTEEGSWCVEAVEIVNGICVCIYDKDLNRAICECVARMQESKR